MLRIMNKAKKIKLFLGSSYLTVVGVFLWFFFNNFTIDEITSYEFIKKNSELLNDFTENNLLKISIIFSLFTIVWVLLLGFGSPIALAAGFIFGKWTGTIITLVSLTIGATLLYLFAKFFLQEIVREKFQQKFINLNQKFKKNEFIYFIIYRGIGGIPFFIQNILPTIFNVKIKNYFFGTLIGIAPQLFIIVSLGSGLEKVISQNSSPPTFFDIATSHEVYIPILTFIVLILIILFIKKKINS